MVRNMSHPATTEPLILGNYELLLAQQPESSKTVIDNSQENKKPDGTWSEPEGGDLRPPSHIIVQDDLVSFIPKMGRQNPIEGPPLTFCPFRTHCHPYDPTSFFALVPEGRTDVTLP